MDYRDTLFPFLQEDCLSKFGQKAGAEIYEKACKRLAVMLETADFRGNKSIRRHISKNMFPGIAYYLTLQEQGYAKEEAYSLTLEETQKAAHIEKRKNESLARLPFTYRLFKLLSKGIIKRMYPAEGWDVEWIRFDNKELQMNFKTCIYAELTAKYECPELCTVFCKNDPVTFSGYEPKIRFERNGTIAEGAPFCDFHFASGGD